MASVEASGNSAGADTGHRVLAVLQSSPLGMSDPELSSNIPDISAQARLDTINKLLKQGLLDICQKGKTIIYRAVDPTKKTIIKGAQNEETIVRDIIKAAGNKGIWLKDIRLKSNLIQVHLNKIIKSLESKKIIKSVKSVNASKQKIYMMYEFEPDRSLTGGAWYHGQDFESEFVEVLNKQCLQFLITKCEDAKGCTAGPIAARNMTNASVAEVHKYIKDLKISNIDLDLEDLETILKTLVYDGKAQTSLVSGKRLYRAVNTLLPVPGLVRTPCGICPVSSKCADTGAITPKKCVYLSEWLD